MTNFNSSKNKIYKLWNKTQEQSITINKQIETNRTIINNLDKLNQSQYASRAVIDVSSDWASYTPLIFSDDLIVEGQSKWELYFPSIPENLISNIRISITRKFDGTLHVETEFIQNIIMQIEDITGSDILKNLTIRASIIIVNGDVGILENLQFKLIAFIINPNLYQKF